MTQVNTDVLDTVLLSLHPAEVLRLSHELLWWPCLPTQIKMILLKVVAASEEVSQRSKEGLAQLHRSSQPSKLPQHLTPLSISDITVIVARFYALIKLEKVEEEEMKALLENLPDEYAAMLGQHHNRPGILFHGIPTLTALMCWFVTLASKMTGIEIPGVGMAPGGKIVKPEQEVDQLIISCTFLCFPIDLCR